MNVFDVLKGKLEEFKNQLSENEMLSALGVHIVERVVEETQKIVDQVEQEHSDGWIPCSERLPDNPSDVLCWYEYYRYGEYNRMFQMYGIGRYYSSQGIWCGEVSNGKKSRVIAWQPLPDSYKGV